MTVSMRAIALPVFTQSRTSSAPVAIAQPLNPQYCVLLIEEQLLYMEEHVQQLRRSGMSTDVHRILEWGARQKLGLARLPVIRGPPHSA
jgi:hypothetical protein